MPEGRSEMMRAEGPIGSFEKERVLLERRLGYVFNDEGFLEHALTDLEGRKAKRREGNGVFKMLEKRGDALLDAEVRRYIDERRDTEPLLKLPVARQRFDNMLRSNWYLSLIGIRLGIDRSVKTNTGRVQARGSLQRNRGEGQARLTADAFEAVVGAIAEDGGDDAGRRFLQSHVFSDAELLKTFMRLSSGKLSTVTKAFSELTRGEAALVRDTERKNDLIIQYRGMNAAVIRSSVTRPNYAWKRIFLFLQENHWLLWGAEGPVSLVIPHKEGSSRRGRRKKKKKSPES